MPLPGRKGKGRKAALELEEAQSAVKPALPQRDYGQTTVSDGHGGVALLDTSASTVKESGKVWGTAVRSSHFYYLWRL